MCGFTFFVFCFILSLFILKRIECVASERILEGFTSLHNDDDDGDDALSLVMMLKVMMVMKIMMTVVVLDLRQSVKNRTTQN